MKPAVQLVHATLADLDEMRRWANANPNKLSPFAGKLFKVTDEEYFAFDAINHSIKVIAEGLQTTG